MNPPSAIICFRYRLELRNVCGQLFLSHSPFPISFFSVFLIVTMDFKAERHKTTFSNIQCQTPKNWRRNQSAKNKMASKKQVGKQKFSWKSIYDSHFLSAWVFLCVCVLGLFSLFLILLLEGVRNCLFWALDLCIYHDYSCTLISFLDNESTREKNTHPSANNNNQKRRQTVRQKNVSTIAIKMETFLFQCLKQTIWCRLTANTKCFWQAHT